MVHCTFYQSDYQEAWPHYFLHPDCRFCPVISGRAVKRTSSNNRWDLIPPVSCWAPEPQVNSQQRSRSGLAFYSQGKKQSLLAAEETAPPGTNYSIILQHAAASPPGNRSTGLPSQRPGWCSRHKLFFMSKLPLMTQLSNWGPQRSS